MKIRLSTLSIVLLVVIGLILFGGFGGVYPYHYGLGVGGLLLIVLIVLIATGRL